MKQLQFYKYAAIGLLLLNLAMLSFFFLTKPKHHRGESMQKDVKAIFNLDDAQNETFLKLMEEHKEKMRLFSRQQKDLLKPYFYNLFDSSKQDEDALDKYEVIERQKIQSIYEHFQDIKSILRKEQLSNFEEFTTHAIERILSDSKKRPPRPKEISK